MAHNILGIDLGSFSVKVVVLEAGFRQTRLVALHEETLLPLEDGEDEIRRRARTLRALCDQHGLTAEMAAVSLGGDAVLRLLTLPLTDPKKIEQVLGYELESQILDEIDDLVIDYVISETGAEQTRVIAAAIPKERVRGLLDALAEVKIEPRLIGSAALSYAALRRHCFDSATEPDSTPIAIVDFGHRHTNVCVVREGKVAFVRAIPRGAEDIDVVLAEVYRLPPEEAQRVKHEQAFLGAEGATFETAAHRKLDETVRAGVRPMLRELRQTLAAYRAGGAAPLSRVLIGGGGSQLRGLREHLQHELGLPVEQLSLFDGDHDRGFVRADEIRGLDSDHLLPAQALGLALAVAAPAPQVNLRKGELAYRTDYSYLRGRALQLGAAVLAILLCAGLNALASLRSLRKEGEGLQTRLKQQTTELFGEPRFDGKAVSEELRGGPRGGAPPVPTLTAFDILDEISRLVPSGDKLSLDVLELDIKPKKVFIKATAETAKQIDDLVEGLNKVECFKSIVKGKTSTVTSPPSGDKKADKPLELKEFQLDIETTCS